MSQHAAVLRPHLGKTGTSSSSAAQENDENSTIKNLIFKHISKGQQSSLQVQTNKGTMRGILGEVGNMTLSNKPLLSKPKIIQQQTSIATLIESKAVVSVPPPAPPPAVADDESIEIMSEDEEVEYGSDAFADFDCDSGDRHNITTASEFVVDICKYWRELELHTPIRQNFLQNRREGNPTANTFG